MEYIFIALLIILTWLSLMLLSEARKVRRKEDLTLKQLLLINQKLDNMPTQKQFEDAIEGVSTKLNGIADSVANMSSDIDELKTFVTEQGLPEAAETAILDKLTALGTQADTVATDAAAAADKFPGTTPTP